MATKKTLYVGSKTGLYIFVVQKNGTDAEKKEGAQL